jgi:lipopolysaccharide transport system permease protein
MCAGRASIPKQWMARRNQRHLLFGFWESQDSCVNTKCPGPLQASQNRRWYTPLLKGGNEVTSLLTARFRPSGWHFMQNPFRTGNLTSAAGTSSSAPVTVIEAQSGWGRLNADDLWGYRHLFWRLIVRDLKSRYRMTALGPTWFIISPFFNMVVLSIVFGQLAKFSSEGLPYPIFLYSATLPWHLFQTSFERARMSLVQYMSWITKIYMPHLMIPLISIATGFLDWLVSLTVLFGLLIFYDIRPGWAVLALPLLTLIPLAVALALGLWVSPLSVRFRDLDRIADYSVMAFYYATPVIYSGTIIPQKWLWLYRLNPMYWAVEGFRWALLGIGQAPQYYMLIGIGVVMLLLLTGLYVFERASRNIADIQ